MTPIEARWETLLPGGFQRIDEDHPLGFYLGVDLSGDRVLLLLVEGEEATPVQSQAIQVLCRKRHDGQWALMFHLVRTELGRIFSHLCEDLIESSRLIPGTTNPARFVLARFERWQRLLKYGHTGLLTEPAIRGLICELLFLQHVSIPRYGFSKAIQGWVGPLDAPQDFCYPDGTFEVKSIHTGSTKVIISSAEQLDDTGIPLDLVAIALDPATRESEGSFCLNDMVSNIRDFLREEHAALSLFEERLLAAGYIDSDEYKNLFFKAAGWRYFTVCDGFPRIIRSHIAPGIGKVTYELDLTSCEPFEENKQTEDSDGY